jgi:peptidoglycan hydrolase-like protein with peptidoglycan-binding domain
MSKITSAQFKQDFSAGIKNDAATQARVGATGVDGKKLLDAADANRDGTIAGAEELGTLFKGIDAFDKDGSRASVSGHKPLAVVNALKAPPAPAAAAGAGAGPDLYGADAGTLKPGARGPEVKAAQEKLLKAGYELPRFGADSDFGRETVTAVKQFQTASKLPPTGELDVATLEKLNRAPAAPAIQFPEYDQMFKDGVMQTTLGLGFDEDGNDVALRRDIVQGLGERGFRKLDVKTLSDEQLKQQGFDPKSIDRDATYFTKPFQHGGKDVQALVKLVDRDTPGAKDKFADGMKQDDLILYSGHGRRGSGPDFDHATSAAGNYVIGKPTEAGHYTLGDNDVGKQGALSTGYQMMFFDACNTNNYLDDLRSRPKNKDTGNLDVIASTRELPWSTSKADILGTLDGVMGGKSIQDIKGGLDAQNAEAGKGAAFVADGFKANSYRPAPFSP